MKDDFDVYDNKDMTDDFSDKKQADDEKEASPVSADTSLHEDVFVSGIDGDEAQDMSGTCNAGRSDEQQQNESAAKAYDTTGRKGNYNAQNVPPKAQYPSAEQPFFTPPASKNDGHSFGPYQRYGAPHPNAGPQFTHQGAGPYSGEYAKGGYYPYYGGPYYPGYANTREKPRVSKGLKAFLTIVTVLCVLSVSGCAVFLLDGIATREERPQGSYSLPEYNDYFDDEIPEIDDDIELPDTQIEQPDIDISATTDDIVSVLSKPEGEELSASEIYSKVAPSTVTVICTKGEGKGEDYGTGTGIIATSDGYIITNSHVVFNTKSNVAVKITTMDGESYDAIVVGIDRITDLAVLKTNDHDFQPAEFGDVGQMTIGEEVIAIGNPGGEQFSSSLTKGVISGLDRTVDLYSSNDVTFIQTDAAINPGNSGGPLVNMYGQVVGINSSKIVSSGYEGMGFAIPVSKSKDIINALCIDGYVKGRTYLGIQGYTITEDDVDVYGIPAGFLIAEIEEGSVFKGTQAKVGDIITEIAQEEVSSAKDIAAILAKHKPGDQVEVVLYRTSDRGSRGNDIEVTVTLREDTGGK